MNENDDLFAGFAVLEPTAEETARAVSRTRAALRAAAIEPANPPAARCARRLAYLAVATAASLLVLLAGLAQISSTSALAWGDAVRRMVGAKSLHCVVEERTPAGQWVRSWEMKYDQQRGFLELHYDQQGLARSEFDNGKSHWVHRRGQKVATRQLGLSAAAQLERLLNPLAISSSLQPEPARDEVIEGVPCRCFMATEPQHQSRVSVWIDENKRLRRALVDQQIDGQWVTWSRANVAYDVEIDPAAFEPRFEEGVKVVDLTNLFEEVCPLDTAVHRQEQFGYVFAIHELKRLDEFEYYMLVSFRPTPETRKKLALRPGEHAGHLFPPIRAKIKHPAEFESGFPLAKARADGIEVSAYLVELRGFELQPMKRARPQFRLNTHAKLWTEFGSWNDIKFDVPLPDEVVSKEEVVRSLYDTIAALEAVPLDELCLHDPRDGRAFVDSETRGGGQQRTTRQRRPKPSEMNFEAFWEHLQERYLQSRPKVTVTPEESR